MLDIKLVEDNREVVEKSLKMRNFKDMAVLDKIADLNLKRKTLITEMESKKALQNKMSKEMPLVMKSGSDEEKKAIREKLKNLSDEIKEYAPEVKDVEAEITDVILSIPNILAADTPEGKDDNDNQVVRMFGEKPEFTFTPKEHFDVAGDYLDFERAVKISASRFVVYRGLMARLERAIYNFMLDLHTEKHGYAEMNVPVLVNRASMTGTGQLPKFEEDAFRCDADDLFLIPTAEVPLTNLLRDEIVDASILPMCITAGTQCFRREAGSYGKDTRGIIRQHQFEKVELVKFTKPEESDAELEKLLNDAEDVLKHLGLHYRVVRLCSGDVGFSSSKTYDIEVWLPGQNAYREISSCSSFTDFQARRANIRFRRENGAKPEFVHTLNGSGLAVGRTLVAVLENYQQEDGSVIIPEVLRKYMNGLSVLSPIK